MLLLRQFHTIQELDQILDGHIRHLIDILITDGDRQRTLLQSLSVALRTRRNAHELLIFLLHRVRSGLTVSTLHIADQTFPVQVIDTLSALSLVMHLKNSPIASVDQHMADLLRKILIRCLQRKAISFRQGAKCCIRVAGRVRTGLPSHHLNRSFSNRKLLIRDHQILIKLHLVTKSVTYRTCTERIVEREASRLHLIHADSAVRAGKVLREIHRLAVYHINDRIAFRQIKDILQRISQTLLNARLDHQSVNHDINIMLDILVHRNLLRQIVHVAIHDHTDITAFLRLFK